MSRGRYARKTSPIHVRRLPRGVRTLGLRIVGFLPLAWGLACQVPSIDAGTDRRVYVLGPGDSVGIVRLTVRNRSTHPLYIQTANGRADIVLLVRVDARGEIVVGVDTGKPESWSLFRYEKPNPLPALGMARLDPESVLVSSYALRRGEYRTLVHFGDQPDSLDEHGVWLDQFSIR